MPQLKYFQLFIPRAQMMKADSMDVLAEERDREVRNILTSIADLAQIMKDLSTLVIDQGTVLDRIDYNMEQARRCPGFRFYSFPTRCLSSRYGHVQRLASVRLCSDRCSYGGWVTVDAFCRGGNSLGDTAKLHSANFAVR